jgi:hypothetical protein
VEASGSLVLYVQPILAMSLATRGRGFTRVGSGPEGWPANIWNVVGFKWPRTRRWRVFRFALVAFPEIL